MAPAVWVADPGEAADVARLLVGFRNHYGKDWPPDDAFLANVRHLIADENTEYLLGGHDRAAAPVGVCQLRFRRSVWTDSDDCWLEDLFVEEAARGTGVGAALVEAALDRARERGCRRIELDVDESNAAARALYARFGFGDHKGRSLFIGRRL